MSYIQDYMNKKNAWNSMIAFIQKTMGKTCIGTDKTLTSPHRQILFNNESVIEDFDIPLWFHMHFIDDDGIKKNNIYYNAMRPYLIKALNHYKYEIMDYIIESIEKDKRDALLNCKQEVESIREQIENLQAKGGE